MFYHITSNCDVELWGISQTERIRKVLAKIANFNEVIDIDSCDQTGNILVLRADYLYEANVIQKLVSYSEAILVSSDIDHAPAALWVKAKHVASAVNYLSGQEGEESIHDLPIMTPQALTGGYDPRLRKYDLSHVVKINSQDQQIIENYLYDKSYKGITDFVTKWFWPKPARWVVRKCANKHITPNMVTSLGWILTIISGVAFYMGEFLVGVCAAWVMTFLDTVDGKLARVTLQSSKLGHVMDHGLDIIHPPIWYWCWAIGLGASQLSLATMSLSIMTWVWIMLAGYIAGRVFEGLFQLFFNDISIFCWRPIDSYHRLITARRNPCLVILTIALLLSSPEQGFLLVVAWTVVSTSWLAVRFLYACLYRMLNGNLSSWISHIDPDNAIPNTAVKLFTGYSAQKTISPLLSKKI